MHSDVVAVGSRSKEKADAYIKEVEGAEGAVGYGSYEEVLEDVNVHAVYIPLPTSMHLKWVQAAAAKGKHILLEKPIAMVRAPLSSPLKHRSCSLCIPSWWKWQLGSPGACAAAKPMRQCGWHAEQ